MHIFFMSLYVSFKHVADTERNRVLCDEVFSFQRSYNNTAHTLLSFSPLHHWLIILSCSVGAVNSDTLY